VEYNIWLATVYLPYSPKLIRKALFSQVDKKNIIIIILKVEASFFAK
jgi:hypothetical protein